MFVWINVGFCVKKVFYLIDKGLVYDVKRMLWIGILEGNKI